MDDSKSHPVFRNSISYNCVKFLAQSLTISSLLHCFKQLLSGQMTIEKVGAAKVEGPRQRTAEKELFKPEGNKLTGAEGSWGDPSQVCWGSRPEPAARPTQHGGGSGALGSPFLLSFPAPPVPPVPTLPAPPPAPWTERGAGAEVAPQSCHGRGRGSGPLRSYPACLREFLNRLSSSPGTFFAFQSVRGRLKIREPPGVPVGSLPDGVPLFLPPSILSA